MQCPCASTCATCVVSVNTLHGNYVPNKKWPMRNCFFSTAVSGIFTSNDHSLIRIFEGEKSCNNIWFHVCILSKVPDHDVCGIIVGKCNRGLGILTLLPKINRFNLMVSCFSSYQKKPSSQWERIFEKINCRMLLFSSSNLFDHFCKIR